MTPEQFGAAAGTVILVGLVLYVIYRVVKGILKSRKR